MIWEAMQISEHDASVCLTAIRFQLKMLAGSPLDKNGLPEPGRANRILKLKKVANRLQDQFDSRYANDEERKVNQQ